VQKYGKIAALIIADIAMFVLSYFLSYMIRFEFDMHAASFERYFPAFTKNIAFLLLIKLATYFALGMYRSLWRYASAGDLLKIVRASFIASLLAIAFLILIQQNPAMPRSIYVLSFVFDTAFTGAIRFGVRYFRGGGRRGLSDVFARRREGAIVPHRIMVVGAGEAGAALIRELRNDRQQPRIIEAAIDDDAVKHGQQILGVKIVGGRADIPYMARKFDIDEIIIAIPSATRKEISAIVAEANKTKCKVRTLPSMKDLIDGKVSVQALRDVNIEDLLGRDPVTLDLNEISGYLEGRIVLITGGGGSIGSELCRQIAAFGPRRLVALDIYENTVFELAGELQVRYPNLDFEPVIASITDEVRMKQVFEKYKPHVVFHAAAHKHVPLMESNPAEAVENNVLGTKILVDLAQLYAVEKFVMISTDKAVNPSNVMGATKRLAEMIVQYRSRRSSTVFAVVRFGNVLGSNGSVIPIFQRQIEMGGPLTVTDKDITRYFMTIPEAVQLVIQSGAMAEGGEIFILDMGEPVRILDLAENLVKLSGLIPYEDIDITITRLRPGEKLHEELSYKNEFLKRTRHEKIYLGGATEPSPLLYDALLQGHGRLEEIIRGGVANMTDKQVKAWLSAFLPAYKEDQHA
jgi:FlaA1/EpsC-like NDP-sugar epimerase